jgi:predicted trehalose synthase
MRSVGKKIQGALRVVIVVAMCLGAYRAYAFLRGNGGKYTIPTMAASNERAVRDGVATVVLQFTSAPRVEVHLQRESAKYGRWVGSVEGNNAPEAIFERVRQAVAPDSVYVLSGGPILAGPSKEIVSFKVESTTDGGTKVTVFGEARRIES